MHRLAIALCLAFLGRIGAPRSDAQEVIPPRAGLEPVAASLTEVLNRELKLQGIPAASIALVEGDRVVWAAGFGQASPKEGRRATASTVFRAGSVSKLFTDLAAMRLVEQGALDLDAPVARYLPDFAPKNPFGPAITLRHLMSHRSGLCREPPVGSTFDDHAPTLAETVACLNRTDILFAPGARTKYSNAGLAVVGRVVEKVAGEPFEKAVRRLVIEPLGLPSTGFEADPAQGEAIAVGSMWTYDGRSFDAPTFPLGTGPAGNLRSSAIDLGRFVAAILAGGKVVRPETLRAMTTPQFDPASGFGLGFPLSEFGGTRRIGHTGAIYGFSSEVAALPDEKLGVAVLVSRDWAFGTASRVADLALRHLLAVKRRKPFETIDASTPLAAGIGRRLEGFYGTGGDQVEVLQGREGVYLLPAGTGFRRELRSRGDGLVADDPFGFGPRIRPIDGGIRLNDAELGRLPDRKPAPPPGHWSGLIGEYGWPYNTLYILERHGRLYALIEWLVYEPLTEVGPDEYRFADNGLYALESLRFTRDASGRATRVVAANVDFPRRRIDGDDGSTFHITPVRSVAELRPEALAAKPPLEQGEFRAADLVEPTTIEPGIKLDIRYASDNNFAGTPFYASARAFLQRPAAEALVKAHDELKAEGFGVLIHDAYRPWYVTKMFWDATPESGHGFVADPSKGSKHNRGCAVDMTLYHLDSGKAVEMVGGYDEFSDRSSPDYPGGTSLQRWRRDLLRRVMERNGFAVNEVEWWHFDYRDWRKYPIINLDFDKIR